MSELLQSTSEQQTREAARSMASSLQRGDVVALYGELGAGKTQFVKGLCDGFRVRDAVTSPTFVILNRYSGVDGRNKEIFLFHFDLYRVQSAEEIYDLGYEEFLFGNGICVVEWAERLGTLLPSRRYDVKIAFGEGADERRISIDRVE
ncbi:MAG: tRNA (adenosine(37)-N6)-threonylcarbamoyltransferase complex ATPase subunit type 1 TsaE [Ignavibacteria bacterium GWA2_54_16]|nr:MAG: tRNA (adenosine(37)-N6)-threonylcarbamoyltransferase complex ATPase subunit type 1 TsaE [Ignavibacteria bacterium GWA2_54_16]